jgi:hypothetical protein
VALNINIQAMPTWPGDSTIERKNTPFVSKGRQVPFEESMKLLERELNAVGAREVTLFTMHSQEDIRVDGRLKADTRTPSHPGVILQFDKYAGYDDAKQQSNFVQLRFPCDTFNGWKTNVRAIALALEALRKVDRYGVTTGAQYAGYKALAAADIDLTPELAADFIARSAGMGGVPGIAASIIQNTGGFGGILYKTAAKLLHPDNGGDPEEFKRLQKAWHIVSAVHKEKSAGGEA